MRSNLFRLAVAPTLFAVVAGVALSGCGDLVSLGPSGSCTQQRQNDGATTTTCTAPVSESECTKMGGTFQPDSECPPFTL